MMVRDRKPLGKRNRRMLGDRVGQRSELSEKSGGRCSVQQVPLAPSDHRGQHGPGRVEVGHHVDVHHLLDSLVGVFDASARHETGV